MTNVEHQPPLLPFSDQDPWQYLREFTGARIALGRAGSSLPTLRVLEFGLAHAHARDSVHASLDAAGLEAAFAQRGFATLCVHSAAADRAIYLRRPDLGRRLDAASEQSLRESAAESYDLAVIVADGLAADAVATHALPVIEKLRSLLPGWTLSPIVIAEQSRVALADQVGELLAARASAICIGERPGLSAPASMGIYLTYAPRVGRTDAERNCISNIHAAGLSHEQAARRLHHLLEGARRLGHSGVLLKDESDEASHSVM